jgi:hypothetical protein
MALMNGVDLPAGSLIEVHTTEERPDLWERSRSLFRDVWPEYNHHGNATPTHFGALFPRYAAFQILVVERSTWQVIVRGRSIPAGMERKRTDQGVIDAAGQSAKSRSWNTPMSADAAS